MDFLPRGRQTPSQPSAGELLNAKRDTAEPSEDISLEQRGLKLVRSFEDIPDSTHYIAWSPDGTAMAAGAGDGFVAVWSDWAGGSPEFMTGHDESGSVQSVAWAPTGRTLATASEDGTVRLWDIETRMSRALEIGAPVMYADWSPHGRMLAAVDSLNGISIWDTEAGVRLRLSKLPEDGYCLNWTPDGRLVVSGSSKGTIYVHASHDLRMVRNLHGPSDSILDIAISAEGDRIASASGDGTVCLWNLHSGQQTVVLEGHTADVVGVCFSPDSEFLVSASSEGMVRLWRCDDWETVSTMQLAAFYGVGGLSFHPKQPVLAIKNSVATRIDCWQVDFKLLRDRGARPGSRRYVNAKVVLLGDTGVGKSGLGLVLSGQPYRPTDSTHGRNVWMFDTQEVQALGGGSQTREVLLWDLAGQPGYRLVHQLHLNEVAVALVVFDSRSETDPFSGVKHWVRALAQARRVEGDAAVPLRAYLVAARADRGGVAVTKQRVEAMVDDLDLDGFFETSAKEGWQVTDLAEAIRDGIIWDALPVVSSSVLFDSIKRFLLEEKQQGRLLSTTDDLFRTFQRLQSAATSDGELRASFEACIGRVESRGFIRRLHFGDLVLLQPELLDAYASAMVQAAKEEPDGLGFIPEEEAFEGRFRLPETQRIRDRAQEKLLLIATVEELLRYEIVLKEMTDQGVDLVFPSQFTRERPDARDIPGKQVIFAFNGPLHNIYATLAVRLSHSLLFKRQAMWQNAASYQATVGGSCGIHLRELEEGRGELALFYDDQAGAAVRMQFEAYVSEHLQLRAIPGTVTRRRIQVCPTCNYVLPDDLVRRRLDRGMITVRCPDCEESNITIVDEEPDAAVAAEATVVEMNRRADARREQDVAMTRLKGKIETGDYDVFLCHNSRDREQIKAIGERLKERGILPWLDVWEIPPGARWQKELQKQLRSIRSAAVFIGRRGAGPWQELEVESLLEQLARRGRPIIPVILEGRQGRPRLPAFLGLWQVVDMRQPVPDPFEQLVWGITGQKQRYG
jgi:WD40 repeat protein